MKRPIPSLRAALCFTCLATVVPAFAVAAEESTEELPEVVITATRSSLETERAPSAVTVITAEDIAQRQYRFVADALRSVPGLHVVQTGSPGQLTSVFTRGLTSEATQVMLDGIPINQGLAGLYNFADLSTENIERIEVVRGPQSTIYGPRAGGGVINIITTRGTRALESSASFEGGTFNTFRESASTSGKGGNRRLFGGCYSTRYRRRPPE